MKSYYYSKLLTENTALETGVRFGGWKGQKHLGFDVRIQHAGDHKGGFFTMDLVFFFFEFNIYDTRHEDGVSVEEILRLNKDL